MKFQLERILLFTDALFAIAITLMIIEIKPPHLEHGISFANAFKILAEIFPLIIGTVLSFFLIGTFWFRHHFVMKYVVAYDTKMFWLNLFFLLSIAFIPFSTAFVFENIFSGSPLTLLVYNINYIAASLLYYSLLNHVFNPSNALCIEDVPENISQIKKETLFPIVIFVMVIILAFINPNIAPLAYALLGFTNVLFKPKKVKKITQTLT